MQPTFLIIFGIIILLFVLPMIIAIVIMKRNKPPASIAVSDMSDMDTMLTDTATIICVYQFPKEIKSFDDMTASSFSRYRNTGKITDFSDDDPIFKRTMQIDKDKELDLDKIIKCATEVKRLNETDVLYFFYNMKELQIKSGAMKSLYTCMKQTLVKSNLILKTAKEPIDDSIDDMIE